MDKKEEDNSVNEVSINDMRLRYIFLYFMLMLFISPSSGQSVSARADL